MKQHRNRSVYRLRKRGIYSSHLPYYTHPYVQSGQPHTIHSASLKGHKTGIELLYNNAHLCPMSPAVTEFIQEPSLQYNHCVNNGVPCSHESIFTAKNTLQFSTPVSSEGNAVDQSTYKTQERDRARKWSREDALKALQFEEELCKRSPKAPCLIIRFPDPPLSPEMVKGFSNDIDVVRLQSNLSPRFCFVRLKDNADAVKVIEDISKIPFGLGYLSAELSVDLGKQSITKPELVDPYTIYVGNLSLSVTLDTLKLHFPGALKYELAFKSKQKGIRYAFIRFDTLKKAMESFKHGMNLRIDGRSLVLTFRRAKLNTPQIINVVESEINNDSDLKDKNNRATKTAISNPEISVVDLTAEDMNIVPSDGKHCLSTQFYHSELIKSEVLEEDSIIPISKKQIKEETYDSEYSCEDECSNSYFDGSNDNSENTYIKSEVNDLEQPSNRSTIFESNVDHDLGACCGKNTKFNKNCSFNVFNAKHYELIPYRNKINITSSFGPADTRTSTSSSASLTEKKYIENLYDQLKSSKIFKKKVRGEFDELEEMLKEVE